MSVSIVFSCISDRFSHRTASPWHFLTLKIRHLCWCALSLYFLSLVARALFACSLVHSLYVCCEKYLGPSRFLSQLWTRRTETNESMSSWNVNSCWLWVRRVQSRKAVFVWNSCWQSVRAGLFWRCVLPALFVECKRIGSVLVWFKVHTCLAVL